MMDEMTCHYKKYANDCTSGAVFGAIGRLMVDRFPNTQREGKHPWAAMTRLLSSRLRQYR